MASVAIEGLDGLIATLRALPPNVAGKLIKPAMQQAGDLLKEKTRQNAYKVLMAAERLGYKRKTGRHLYETAATRAKTYRSGNTTFVAVGFDYTAGGSHAHLVEKGHAIVKGGTLKGITVAGKRFLHSQGWAQGDWVSGEVLHGKRKGQPRTTKGAWKFRGGGITLSTAFGTHLYGKRIAGGGRATGGRTSPKPMLGPAFDLMARPMLITIENELRKIGVEAERLAKNAHKPTDSIVAAGWARSF
jgi:hypothetical protein